METEVIELGIFKKEEFQKDLIVWKQKSREDRAEYGYVFQKDLIVWKHFFRCASEREMDVSEGLNSVETKGIEFPEGEKQVTFQKDLIVWKLRGYIRSLKVRIHVSEGLNSVETPL